MENLIVGLLCFSFAGVMCFLAFREQRKSNERQDKISLALQEIANQLIIFNEDINRR